MRKPQGELTIIPDAFDSIACDGIRSLTIRDETDQFFIGWIKPGLPLNEGNWRPTFPIVPLGTYLAAANG
jgi:hypothetical protein